MDSSSDNANNKNFNIDDANNVMTTMMTMTMKTLQVAAAAADDDDDKNIKLWQATVRHKSMKGYIGILRKDSVCSVYVLRIRSL